MIQDIKLPSISTFIDSTKEVATEQFDKTNKFFLKLSKKEGSAFSGYMFGDKKDLSVTFIFKFKHVIAKTRLATVKDALRVDAVYRKTSDPLFPQSEFEILTETPYVVKKIKGGISDPPFLQRAAVHQHKLFYNSHPAVQSNLADVPVYCGYSALEEGSWRMVTAQKKYECDLFHFTKFLPVAVSLRLPPGLKEMSMATLLQTASTKLVKSLDYKNIAKILHQFKDLAECLQTFHKDGFLHRDVAPGNILLDEQFHLKLNDFEHHNKKFRRFEVKPGRLYNYWDLSASRLGIFTPFTDFYGLSVCLAEAFWGYGFPKALSQFKTTDDLSDYVIQNVLPKEAPHSIQVKFFKGELDETLSKFHLMLFELIEQFITADITLANAINNTPDIEKTLCGTNRDLADAIWHEQIAKSLPIEEFMSKLPIMASLFEGDDTLL